MDKLENGSRVMSMCMEEMESGERNMDGKMLEFCDEKELCVANTWFRKEESDVQRRGKWVGD